MFRSLITLLLFAGLGVSSAPVPPKTDFQPADLLMVHPIPRKSLTAVSPVVEAQAALLMDVKTGLVLYEKAAHTPMPIASLTKIMTAMVILDSHSLNEVVTVTEDFNAGEDVGVRMWLRQYEKMTVGNLLIGLLVQSGGDAAVTLAQFHSGSVSAFADVMNQKAKELHLQNTRFTNPVGMDDPDHYSTAYDMAILTKYALRHPDFRRIVQIRKATVASTDDRIQHEIYSTNLLLGNSFLDIRGVKTGTTENAGESVINLAYGSKNAEILSVVLNSPQRFQESKIMINWLLSNFSW